MAMAVPHLWVTNIQEWVWLLSPLSMAVYHFKLLATALNAFISLQKARLIVATTAIKVAGHPACSAMHQRVEIEWEICHVDLSLPSKSMAENCAPNLSRQRSGTALKLLWQLLAMVLFAGTHGYWQQMK